MPALVGPAPDVRQGVDEAAVDEREGVGAERRRQSVPVGAVTVEQQRRGAVALQVPAMKHGDRHASPVGSGREQP